MGRNREFHVKMTEMLYLLNHSTYRVLVGLKMFPDPTFIFNFNSDLEAIGHCFEVMAEKQFFILLFSLKIRGCRPLFNMRHKAIGQRNYLHIVHHFYNFWTLPGLYMCQNSRSIYGMSCWWNSGKTKGVHRLHMHSTPSVVTCTLDWIEILWLRIFVLRGSWFWFVTFNLGFVSLLCKICK